MADITLGQTIQGSFTSSDPKINNFGFYDDYDLKSVDNFRQLRILVESPNITADKNTVEPQLVNATTGARLAQQHNP